MNEYLGLTFNDLVILYALLDWSRIDEEIPLFFKLAKSRLFSRFLSWMIYCTTVTAFLFFKNN